MAIAEDDLFPQSRPSSYLNPLHHQQQARERSMTAAEVHAAYMSNRYSHTEHQPMMISTLMVARPKSCCAFWCCFYFATTLLLTVVLAFAGLDPINTDKVGEVFLGLPFDRFTLIEQAFLRTQEIAKFGEETYTCRQSNPTQTMTLIIEVSSRSKCAPSLSSQMMIDD